MSYEGVGDWQLVGDWQWVGTGALTGGSRDERKYDVDFGGGYVEYMREENTSVSRTWRGISGSLAVAKVDENSQQDAPAGAFRNWSCALDRLPVRSYTVTRNTVRNLIQCTGHTAVPAPILSLSQEDIANNVQFSKEKIFEYQFRLMGDNLIWGSWSSIITKNIADRIGEDRFMLGVTAYKKCEIKCRHRIDNPKGTGYVYSNYAQQVFDL